MSPQFYVRVITITAAASIALQPVLSQGRGGTATPPSTGSTAPVGTGTGTGTVTNPGRTTPNTTTNPNSNPTQTPQTINQPIFVSGRVMLDDGTAPTEQIVIQTVCNGIAHSEGYADSKGFFGIELGSKMGVIQDASEFGNYGTFGSSTPSQQTQSQTGSMFPGDTSDRRFMNCELQAKLTGYRSQTVNLAHRRALDDPNVGTILLHHIGATEEGKTVSAISLAAPKEAKKAFDKGMDAAKKKKLDEAQKNWEKAVELYPKYATAWYELGRLQMMQGKMDDARQSFDTASKADPKYMLPYLQLMQIALQKQKWEELADLTDRAVKLDPFSFPQAFLYNSVANFNLKNLDVAEKSALAAEKLDTRHQYPDVSHLLGLILAQRQDYTGAAVRFRNYLQQAPTAPAAATVRLQLDQIEKMTAQSAAPKPEQDK
jgi:tetratricopeptide (TPR) repeat protein